jgi:hypothetical protein
LDEFALWIIGAILLALAWGLLYWIKRFINRRKLPATLDTSARYVTDWETRAKRNLGQQFFYGFMDYFRPFPIIDLLRSMNEGARQIEVMRRTRLNKPSGVSWNDTEPAPMTQSTIQATKAEEPAGRQQNGSG